MHLPLDFADALAQARGLGVGFVPAHQYMHQLDPPMRSAVLANAQSRVAFRLPSEDARLIAAGSPLAPEDFQSLGAFQCYAQLVASAAVQPWCSAQHLAAWQAAQRSGDGARRLPRAAYGVDRAEVEAELHELFVGRSRAQAAMTSRHGGETAGVRHECLSYRPSCRVDAVHAKSPVLEAVARQNFGDESLASSLTAFFRRGTADVAVA